MKQKQMENDLIRRKDLADSIQQLDIYPVCIRRAIERAPTVDAVEVVRCKDCKHWHGGDCYRIEITRPDDFCSYGERRLDECD